jgi:hypothetical protein
MKQSIGIALVVLSFVIWFAGGAYVISAYGNRTGQREPWPGKHFNGHERRLMRRVKLVFLVVAGVGLAMTVGAFD